MFKVKHERDCDCVVAGFRWHKDGEGTAVGSLLLGLYDDAGALQHVGVCASFTAAEAARAGRVPRALPRERARVSPVEGVGRRRRTTGATGERSACRRARAAGARARTFRGSRCAPSWWSRWPTITCRDRASGTRRSSAGGAPTRAPRDCTYAQLEVVPPHELAAIFASSADACAAAVTGVFLRLLARLALATRASGRRRDRASPAAGGAPPGTWRRLTRMRVQVDERPRIESTSTSSTARCAAACGCFAFQRSRPASAASLLGRVGDDDERHLRPRRRLRARSSPLRARGRDARRLAVRLAKVRRPGRVAEARRPRRAPRARGASRANRAAVHLGVRVAERARSAAGTVRTVKSAGSQSATSSQRERRRHARVGQRADRVGRAGRAILGVLVVVEEDAVPLLLPPLGSRERRRAALDLARERERGAAHLGRRSSAARCAR